jgi:hypothetical protein
MDALTSMLDEVGGDAPAAAEPAPAAGGDMIDTSNWAADIFGDDDAGFGAPEPEAPKSSGRAKPPPIPPPRKK